MQINRLFEIVYILFEKKTITARELSERFEVSQRTIYRDIDVLSIAGIPIYTNKGKGGGISILPEFVLNKSVLSDTEQNEILSALQSLNALQVPNIDPVLSKLAALFNKNNTSWIDVDFSHWGSNDSEREKFKVLKNVILTKKVIEFDYYSSYGEKSTRRVEPLKLVFKDHGWYIYGYCKLKNDYRMFKVTRIKRLLSSEESFNRDTPKDIWWDSDDSYKSKMITLVLKIDGKMAYRVFDEFCPEDIESNIDGSFTVKTIIPESDWIYGYLMFYGEYAEVLEPKHIKDTITSKYEKALKKYL
ncbi:helix-turn-helix transcriptional regulator [Clostridium sp. ZS2-4]|uniref:helix-turn-helix transcriptional regulator n=1 Tax=Clostridium sp. ZS2-4 TaxID=2987703 RepID=UPI00227ACF69|nr:YafY family protein [Clostridium sp. ZS2-4]MCY6356450.1 YafY family protein [Clostridium sp. ZS2-4]